MLPYLSGNLSDWNDGKPYIVIDGSKSRQAIYKLICNSFDIFDIKVVQKGSHEELLKLWCGICRALYRNALNWFPVSIKFKFLSIQKRGKFFTDKGSATSSSVAI